MSAAPSATLGECETITTLTVPALLTAASLRSVAEPVTVRAEEQPAPGATQGDRGLDTRRGVELHVLRPDAELARPEGGTQCAERLVREESLAGGR